MGEKLIGNCMTTAMGIMPHLDVDRALKLAMSFDIPFWPQLPRVSIYEDMYAQLSEHMPGISVDEAARQVNFSLTGFYDDLATYVEKAEDPAYFNLSPRYSLVYDAFLNQDFSHYYAIRGQQGRDRGGAILRLAERGGHYPEAEVRSLAVIGIEFFHEVKNEVF